MFKRSNQHRVIAPEDPWRWLTFSGFWGSNYYLLARAGLIAGQQSSRVSISQRAALVSFGLYLPAFIAGGALASLLEQRLVGRSAKEQSEQAIASGMLEPSIPLQTLGGATGAVVPLGLVVFSQIVAAQQAERQHLATSGPTA